MLFNRFVIIFICTITTACLSAQADVAGAEDHPLLTRYPGSRIAWYATEKYLEYDLATGPIAGYRNIKERKK
ncbi:MAG: hypothetical protein AAGF89_14690, partial [Bacteroidota bacterium]